MEGQESAVTLLDRRCIEAAMLAQVYAVLSRHMGAEQAIRMIEETVCDAALAAGQAFSASAPAGPSLAHFQSVVDLWQRGNALTIERVRCEPGHFSFAVTRCRYVERYREMGLPEALVTRISCLRDGAFVTGYSPHLHFERPQTIAGGAACCPFTFTWEA